MKKILYLFALVSMAVAIPVLETGCSTAQTQTTLQTLDAVGHTARASMDAATAALKSGAITAAQWQKIAYDYDNVFQPAFNLAFGAAAGLGSSPAPASLVTSQTAFSASVNQLIPITK